MEIIDWIFFAIVVISTIFSIRRGFVKEALSLITWAAAIVVAYLFSSELATLLGDHIETPSMRLIVAVLILFAATLVVGAMVNHLLADFVRVTGLTGPDKTFGIAFGVLRGFLIVLILVILAGNENFPFREDDWWDDSLLIPKVEDAGDSLYRIYKKIT